MENFQERYQKLNKEQQEAVDTILGPVMVIAGPGTGKTEILSLRIANILQKQKDVVPSELLALTFTRSGVEAMRRRLISLIGHDAYKVNIYTFHSFCEQIISDNSEEFIFSKELKLISDIERIKLLRKLIDTLNSDATLKPFGDPYHYMKDIQAKIRILKQEDISPAKLTAAVLKQERDFENLPEEELYHQKGAHKGKKKKMYKDLEKDISKQKELAVIYTQYQDHLKRMGRYDFEDMIMFVSEKFQKDKQFLEDYQELFKFILVDEYQDTNNSQNTIIKQLVAGQDTPNLFVVGDDDQAIYRFQGASMENFLFFHEIHPGLKIIPLRQNYRSTQTIINGATTLINHNKDRITNIIPNLEKSFKANVSHQEKPIVLASLSSLEVEAFYIVEKIKELHTVEQIPYSEMAILYRNNRNAQDLSELLKKEAIPFSLSSDQNALDNFYIQRLLSALKILVNPYSNDEFFNFLYAGFFQISDDDMYKITPYTFREKKSIFDIMNNPEQIPNLSKATVESLSQLSTVFFKLKQESHKLPLKDFVIKALHELKILEALLKQGDNLYDLNQINSFLNWITGQAQYLNKCDLRDFLEDVALLYDSDVSIATNTLLESQLGVNLMTAHKSKGLEFRVVFLMQCHSKNLEKQANKEKLKLPKNLIFSQKKQQVNEDKEEEERRLFYVASTRAKEKLFYTYAQKNYEGNDLNPSIFLSEAEKKCVQTEDVTAYEVKIKERILQRLQDETTSHWKQEISTETLKQIVKNYVLSPTALNNYLSCPAKFKYTNLFRIPTPPSKHLSLGSAVHNTLEEVFKQASKEKKLPSFERWEIIYKEMAQNNILPSFDKKAILEEGLKLLSDYYAEYKDTFHIDCLLEYEFKNIFLDDVPLTGKLDKIEILSNGKVNIIDYKTGKPKTLNDILGKTKNSNGDYYRQLVFYNLLADLNDEFDYEVNTVSLDFIKPKDNGEFYKAEFRIDKQEIEELKTTIREVYQKIQNLEFPPTSDMRQCAGFKIKCDFWPICHKKIV